MRLKMIILDEESGKKFEVPSATLSYKHFSYNGVGSGTINFSEQGRLADDPKPMVNPLKKAGHAKPLHSLKDALEDNDYILTVRLYYQTDVWFDNKPINENHKSSRHYEQNFMPLWFTTRAAKEFISSYKKGDSLAVFGELKTKSLATQNGYSYISGVEVIKAVGNPVSGIVQTAQDFFSPKNKPIEKTYHSVEEIINDKSLTAEEQNKMIVSFVRNGGNNFPSERGSQKKPPLESVSAKTNTDAAKKSESSALHEDPLKTLNKSESDSSLNSLFNSFFE